jgi:nucleotide-binding universal stress UspA family protein
MLRIDRLLFPTDVSDRLEGAVPMVIGLAQRFGAEVHLLHNLDPTKARVYDQVAESADPGAHFAAAEAEIEHRLEELAERLEQGVGSKVTVAVAQKTTPDDAICEYVTANEVDLVVMVTRPKHTLRERLFGSITQDVLHDCPCSVWTVNADRARESPGWQRILVPTEVHDRSYPAIAVAASLLDDDGEAQLLHVFEAHAFPKFYGPPGHEKTYYSFEELEIGLRDEMLALWQQEGRADVSASAHVLQGRPAREILASAAKLGSDLIVTSAIHEHRFLRSIAEVVAFESSPCPVLLARDRPGATAVAANRAVG